MDTLRSLRAHHRAALTLRYVDDMPVAAVADRSHGRAGRLADPFGHLWIISVPLAPDRGVRS